MLLAPIKILKDEASEEKDENARLSMFVGAMAIGDLVKSTLGPHGMDKILISAQDGKMMSTNDGATILKSIPLDNPAAQILVDISKVQDNEVGDGTTSVCILASELLREAERLISSNIHPQVIADGYRMSCVEAKKCLEAMCVDNSQQKDLHHQMMINTAKTTLSSKILSTNKEHFAKISVDAILRLGDVKDLKHIHIIKKLGGQLQDSYLDDGFILDKAIGNSQPKRIENAKILLANTPMDTDKIKIFGARIKVDSTAKLAEIERAERDKMASKIEKIQKFGINCFINRQLIYNWPEQLFADANIIGIEHADFDGIERLALVTGGEIVSTFDHPELVKTGKCDLIEEILIGDDRLIKFSGVAAGNACTIVLRGPTQQILDEAERSLHDALCALLQLTIDPRIIPGGGASEVHMACSVYKLAESISGKKSIAVEAFARALLQLPMIIADNGGFDSSELVSQLKVEHFKGKHLIGLDMANGKTANMYELGIVESYKLKKHVLTAATDAAEMIIRVDNIIKCAPRPRSNEC